MTARPDLISVSVQPVPGRMRTVELVPGSTVHDALDSANIQYSGSAITVNGHQVDLDYELSDGTIITVSKRNIRGA